MSFEVISDITKGSRIIFSKCNAKQSCRRGTGDDQRARYTTVDVRELEHNKKVVGDC